MSAGLHDETTVKLTERNSHQVDAETIARMKNRYEPDVAEELACFTEPMAHRMLI